jgi:F-type H+-transporting ATPase subunit b
MKIPAGHERNILNKKLVLVFFIIGLILLNIGIALGSAGAQAETKGWVTTDWYRVMNFAVLAIALFFLLKKPVSAALNQRIKDIKAQLAALEARKDDAEKELAKYNEKLATLEGEAEKIIEGYIKQGNEARERIIREAGAAAEKLEEQSKITIEQEFEKAKLELRDNILENALNKAEERIKEKFTSEDQNKLVDEYLEKVVA